MHKSRLGGFIIDCNSDDLDAADRTLDTPADQPHLEVQRVAHPSRVHLDIEADDIEAEVGRLEKLGARRIGPVATWYVMEAPTGQHFCVVRAQRTDFDAEANTWND